MASMTPARKAAMLLITLDPKTSAELLAEIGPDVLTQIAAEFATLGPVDPKSRAASETVHEFMSVLSGGDAMLGRMLGGVMDAKRSSELLNRAYDIITARDPFMMLRSTEPEQLAAVLVDESPQVISMVLSELQPVKAGRILVYLSDDARKDIISCMAGAEDANLDTKKKVAATMREKLKRQSERVVSVGRDYRKEQLRKVALLLQGLRKNICDAILTSLIQKSAEVGKAVRNLMVVWEDIPRVSDRSMQEALHVMDSRQIALALVEADDAVGRKIKGNLSQRALAMLEEEIAIMPTAKPEEVEEAREVCLGALRELNENNMLTWT
ncbi:MAG: hypothetical protein HZA50_06285 [Planctomycetes bacterium]|nr:hypothetical protein [Planctomycetota bacterium]